MKRYFFLVSIIVLLISCSSQKDAIRLNETIDRANKEINVVFQNFTNRFEAIHDNNYSGLEADRQKIITLYDSKIKEINGAKANMKEGEHLKNCVLDYYKFDKVIYETDYKELCQLTGINADQEKATTIFVRMQGEADKEAVLRKNIYEEQQKFAEANNLDLKKRE